MARDTPVGLKVSNLYGQKSMAVIHGIPIHGYGQYPFGYSQLRVGLNLRRSPMNRECKHPTCGVICRRERKVKKRYRIPRYSKKREQLNKVYDARARLFRKANPQCKIMAPGGCTGKTQGVHHRKGRGRYLLDESTWIPACNYCNGYVEAHPAWAVENGFKESKYS